MKLIQPILECLAGNKSINFLTAYLEEHFDDFADVQNRYLYALNILQAELDDHISRSTQKLKDAIEQQAISNLTFSCALGFKANLDHFINPIARTFMDVDFEVFLYEETARTLPVHKDAQATINLSNASIAADHYDVFEAVSDYISYLETVVPKLAHYYGFLLGNTILSRILPGYHPDIQLTNQYKLMIETYFGFPVD